MGSRRARFDRNVFNCQLPGPYLIGIGDVIGYEELIGSPGAQSARGMHSLIVDEDVLIHFFSG